jgi:hypothetical protein
MESLFAKAIWRKKMNRTASVRKVQCVGTTNESSGPDSMYVVDLIENGQVVESRKLPGKSMAYVNDVCENWNNGIIQLLVD